MSPTDGDERTKGYTWMQSISGTFGVLAYAIGAVFNNYVLIYAGAVIVLLFSILPPLFITEPRELEPEISDANAYRRRTGRPRKTLSCACWSRYVPLWGFLVYDIYAMGRRMAGVEPSNYYAEIACAVVTMHPGDPGPGWKRIRGEARQPDFAFRKVIAAHSFSWVGIQTTFVFLFAFLQQQMPQMTGIWNWAGSDQ